jgi:acetylornithine/succinyldiaminopimelate/putrescine aminotransferase
MKVKELIEKLKEMPEDAEVFHSNDYCGDDATVDEVTLDTNAQRFLDWSGNWAVVNFMHCHKDVKEVIWLSGDH